MLLLMGAWLLLGPLLDRLHHGALIVTVSYFAILGVGLYSATSRRRLRSWLLVGLLTTAILAILSKSVTPGAGPISAMLHLFYVVYVPLAMIRHALGATRITGETITGSVSAYLLFGIAWGFSYVLFDQFFPGSFSIPSELAGDTTVFYYFSFATLTTLGYGDVTPVSAPARALASIEALAGQLYLVVLVARLVSLHTVRLHEQHTRVESSDQGQDQDVPTRGPGRASRAPRSPDASSM